jgi:hypothetical protein
MAQRDFWWIGATDEDGKPYLLGGGETEEIARQKGMELLNGLDFELKNLHTTDKNLASSRWRGHKLEQTHTLKKAGQRLGHEKSLKRKKQRESPTIW